MDKKSIKSVKTSMLKCGKRTYFFDINLASNNKRYLRVTESRFQEEEKDRIRKFQDNLKEAVGYLAQWCK